LLNAFQTSVFQIEQNQTFRNLTMKRFFIATAAICFALINSVAQAGTIASSSLNIENFLVTSTATLLPPSFSNSVGLTTTLGPNTIIDSFPTLNAGPQNVAQGLSFSQAASIASGSGSVLIPPGTSVLTTADVNIDDSNILDGFARTTLTFAGSFTAQSAGVLTVSFDGEAMVSVVQDGGLVHSGGGSTLFQLGLTRDGLSENLLASLDSQASILDLAGPGSAAGSFTQTINLLAGSSYSFNLTQSNSAFVNAIPEPSSFAAFAILGLFGVAARRRRA